MYISLTHVTYLPTTTKKLHTAENYQEVINMSEHKIYAFYIHLGLTSLYPSHFIIRFTAAPSSVYYKCGVLVQSHHL